MQKLKINAYFLGDILKKGERLLKGQQLSSQNGRFRAKLDDDGNFVLYAGAIEKLWEAQPNGQGFGVYFEENGNLALKNDQLEVLFSSNTENLGEYLKYQNDGNLAIFNLKGSIEWSTGTTQSNFFLFNCFLLFLLIIF